MKTLTLILAALTLVGCSATARDVVIYKQTVERIDYLASPQGNRYILEQISVGGRVW